MKGGFNLRTIKLKIVIFAVISCLGILLTLLLLIKSNYVLNNINSLAIKIVLTITFISIGLFIYEYEKYKIAKLILENKILHIQSAKIEEEIMGKRTNSLLFDGLEVYISCFGILLDSKVIKFNIDKINLKKVVVDSKYIYFTYGVNRFKSIKILHGNMNSSDLHEFVERFSYETGIRPTFSI